MCRRQVWNERVMAKARLRYLNGSRNVQSRITKPYEKNKSKFLSALAQPQFYHKVKAEALRYSENTIGYHHRSSDNKI